MNWRGRGGNNWFALCVDISRPQPLSEQTATPPPQCKPPREGVKEFSSPAVIPDIRHGDNCDGKQPPGIVSSSPPRCVLRSGASHSLQWGVMPALRRRFRIFSFRYREMKIPE